MRTKLIRKKEIAEGTTEILLERPEGFRFKPGQYALIILPELTEGNRRELSIASSPNDEKQLRFAFRNSESSFKKGVLKLEIGSTLEIEGPYGLFTLQKNESNVVLIAGGIGITPFMSMMRFAAEEKAPVHITLISINPSDEKTPFKEDLRRFEADNPNMRVVKYIGRQSSENFLKEIPEGVERIYVAGPPGMVSKIRQTLAEGKIDEEKILAEDFIGYA